VLFTVLWTVYCIVCRLSSYCLALAEKRGSSFVASHGGYASPFQSFFVIFFLERERERESMCVYVCVCREREEERMMHREERGVMR
jgi:hypothetical protein